MAATASWLLITLCPVQVVASRQQLEDQYQQAAASETEPTRPEHWGGYIVKPIRIEFWQGRSSRLHDRILYEKQKDGSFTRVRLSP
jgi:pyridoxamine 5'-phosphate oxidase